MDMPCEAVPTPRDRERASGAVAPTGQWALGPGLPCTPEGCPQLQSCPEYMTTCHHPGLLPRALQVLDPFSIHFLIEPLPEPHEAQGIMKTPLQCYWCSSGGPCTWNAILVPPLSPVANSYSLSKTLNTCQPLCEDFIAYSVPHQSPSFFLHSPPPPSPSSLSYSFNDSEYFLAVPMDEVLVLMLDQGQLIQSSLQPVREAQGHHHTGTRVRDTERCTMIPPRR